MSDNLNYNNNLKNIRNCIDRMLDDVELNTFCFDYYYTQVFNRISRGMEKGEKITLLLTHCRTLPHRMEKLLSRLEEKDPEIFAYFEIRKTKEQLKNQSQKRSSPLIEEILEWKTLHNYSQIILFEVEKILSLFCAYKTKPSLDTMSKAGFTWQEDIKKKLIILDYSFKYAKITEIHRLHDQINDIHRIVQKMMGDVDHEDFLYLNQWFLDLKYTLWKILEISDHSIKETAQAL